jgi:zinc/manganese transport system ATP-binding protein
VYFAGGTAVEGAPREVITSETLTRLYAAPIEVLETSDRRLVVVGTPEPPAIHGDRHGHGHSHAH